MEPAGDQFEPVEPVGPETELDKVQRWRLQTLLDAGYPVPLAEKLAASDADLHQAVELVERGCSPRLATEILY